MKQKSLRQVAKELGVSASYLSQIRHGKRPASEKMLNTLLFKDVQDVQESVKHDKVAKECYNSINPIVNEGSLGHRLAVGQRTLDPLAEVRILVPQPHLCWTTYKPLFGASPYTLLPSEIYRPPHIRFDSLPLLSCIHLFPLTSWPQPVAAR